jgi:hypothetical protein
LDGTPAKGKNNTINAPHRNTQPHGDWNMHYPTCTSRCRCRWSLQEGTGRCWWHVMSYACILCCLLSGLFWDVIAMDPHITRVGTWTYIPKNASLEDDVDGELGWNVVYRLMCHCLMCACVCVPCLHASRMHDALMHPCCLIRYRWCLLFHLPVSSHCHLCTYFRHTIPYHCSTFYHLSLY